MKKLLITLILLIGFTSVQIVDAQDLKFGVKAGLNISTMNFDEVYGDTKMKLGFQLGCVSEYKINKKIAVEADLLLSQQGFKSEVSGTGFKKEMRQNAYYINVPLMFKWYVVDKLSVAVGPQLGLVISARDKETSNCDGEAEKVTKFNIGDKYKAADFGMCLAADYYITEKIFAGAKYALGMTNLYKGDNYDLKSKNRVITIGFGYQF